MSMKKDTEVNKKTANNQAELDRNQPAQFTTTAGRPATHAPQDGHEVMEGMSTEQRHPHKDDPGYVEIPVTGPGSNIAAIPNQMAPDGPEARKAEAAARGESFSESDAKNAGKTRGSQDNPGSWDNRDNRDKRGSRDAGDSGGNGNSGAGEYKRSEGGSKSDKADTRQ